MTLIIHQALHGYNDGHRLISSSFPLTSSEARTMVVMSDLSGSGIKPAVEGYLTGYPLESSGKYVLARTWNAPEMPRPGCVWTHSLIIDNADLATLKSAEDLLTLFRRPNINGDRDDYLFSHTIEPTVPNFLLLPHERLRGLVNALYAAPERVVVTEATDVKNDEQILLAIWMQQWPRLRRSFGFCTLSGVDRSKKGVHLDIQIVPPGDRHIHSKFSVSITPEKVNFDPALVPLIADLEGKEPSDIREFLRRAGGDVNGGRQAMVPLCSIYSALFSGIHPDLSAAVNALNTLNLFGVRQARSLRIFITKTALEKIDVVNDTVFNFVLDTLNCQEDSSNKFLSTSGVGAALWRRSPIRFFEIVDAGGVIGTAAKDALPEIPTSALIRGLQSHPDLIDRVSGVRRDLLDIREFWKIEGIDTQRFLDSITTDEANRIAPVLLEAEIGNAASLIVERAAPAVLASAINEGRNSSVLDLYIKAIAKNPNKAASIMASGNIRHRKIIVELAKLIHPDWIPNDIGEDPWIIAVNATKNLSDKYDEGFLAAFLVARALGHRSQSEAKLFQFAYTTLYRALASGRLFPNTLDAVLENRLGKKKWFDWDQCARLRDATVSTFINRHLDPKIFGCLTVDEDLMTSLIDATLRLKRGRKYLIEVLNSLSNLRDEIIIERAKYIYEKIE